MVHRCCRELHTWSRRRRSLAIVAMLLLDAAAAGLLPPDSQQLALPMLALLLRRCLRTTANVDASSLECAMIRRPQQAAVGASLASVSAPDTVRHGSLQLACTWKRPRMGSAALFREQSSTDFKVPHRTQQAMRVACASWRMRRHPTHSSQFGGGMAARQTQEMRKCVSWAVEGGARSMTPCRDDTPFRLTRLTGFVLQGSKWEVIAFVLALDTCGSRASRRLHPNVSRRFAPKSGGCQIYQP
ncbi:hypothetical protein AC579_2036 [Pseudocercospora musae]|uniref:Secreted protein n=1 Tax=Pseudocercospora musae TaxID=113226 RepID=A0A139IQN7_9PEZI|nr:hypothetical protein AC579_2036 [Pseudocercospora musae]